MKPLRIELIASKLFGAKHWIVVLASVWLLAGLSTLAAVQRWKRVVELDEQVRQAERLVANSQAKGSAQRTSIEESNRALEALVAPQIERWLAARSFPWDPILLSLERAVQTGVQLRSLSLEAETGITTLVVSALDDKAVHGLLQALNGGEEVPIWTLRRMELKGGPGGERERTYEAEFASRQHRQGTR